MKRRISFALGLPQPPAYKGRNPSRSFVSMSFLSPLFVWWYNATPGTLFTTWFSGVKVGDDQFGNRYYQNRDGKRRWVIYAGTVEASRVPPDWHGWMHHTYDNPPTIEPMRVQPWESAYEPNLTGTPEAHRPEGSLWNEGKRPPATGDYQPWRPN